MSIIKYLKTRIARYLDPIPETSALLLDIRNFLHTAYYEQELKSEYYQNPKRLLRYGYKIFSQSDEDGIINEIFKRIDVTSRTFFEFGVGDGSENNTVNLLLSGWRGCWIECNESNVKKIKQNLLDFSEQLTLLDSFVTVSNINSLFEQAGLPGEIDFLSIDIDSNDYWIWEAIDFTPRVVCIEYNATLRPPHSLAIKYDPNFQWQGTSYMGASLKALERLGTKKGYLLVGCNFTGNNAFFVRNDLVGEHFLSPFTAENHYEPPRYLTLRAGHRAGIGTYVNKR